MVNPASERYRAATQFLVLFVLAALVRCLLSSRFFGWEEGDYGNLMMIREVIDSGFTWFRTAHMPGWYSMAALLQWTHEDPRGSALAMTICFSALNVAGAALLARKLLSPAAGWLAGSWLILQPEMALYGASTLRSPVFTSLGFLGMALLIWGARARGFGLTGLAFLVRMEAFASFYVPALWSWTKDRGQGWRRIGLPLVLLLSVVMGWQAYISLVQERCLGVEFNLQDIGRCWETAFIVGPVMQNLAPDVHGGLSGFNLAAWVKQGLATTWILLSWTLPRKLSWIILLAAVIGLIAMLRGAGRPGSATVAVYAVFTLSVWLLEGFLAHHDPNHNLYWVWLLPSVPFIALLGAAGWFSVDRRLLAAPTGLRLAFLLAMMVAPLPSFVAEGQYQMDRAERWYRPQLELSRWMEDTLPGGTGVLVSSIPEVWLKRQDRGLRIYSWWLLPDEVPLTASYAHLRAKLAGDLNKYFAKTFCESTSYLNVWQVYYRVYTLHLGALHLTFMLAFFGLSPPWLLTATVTHAFCKILRQVGDIVIGHPPRGADSLSFDAKDEEPDESCEASCATERMSLISNASK